MSDSGPIDTFSAYVLMAVGSLIAVLCGGCTAVVLCGALQTPLNGSPPYNGGEAAFAPIIGGVPTAVGIWAFLKGWGMLRRTKAQQDIDRPARD
jgi:di/tricarboxylate transporter